MNSHFSFYSGYRIASSACTYTEVINNLYIIIYYLINMNIIFLSELIHIYHSSQRLSSWLLFYISRRVMTIQSQPFSAFLMENKNTVTNRNAYDLRL